MNFCTQKKRKGKNASTRSGFVVECRREEVWENVWRSSTFQPGVPCAGSEIMWGRRTLGEKELDYITACGMWLHQWNHCGKSLENVTFPLLLLLLLLMARQTQPNPLPSQVCKCVWTEGIVHIQTIISSMANTKSHCAFSENVGWCYEWFNGSAWLFTNANGLNLDWINHIFPSLFI